MARKGRLRRRGNWIVVCPATGDRLCKDMKWRGFANFGTYPECVKIYTYQTAALAAGARHIHPHNKSDTISRVVNLLDGDEVNAAGQIKRKGDQEWRQM